MAKSKMVEEPSDIESVADVREEVHVLPLERCRIKLRVRGTVPLCCNNFSAKARQMMRDKQGGEAVVKGAKSPRACFEAAFYPMQSKRGAPPRYGMPAVSFKCAMVDACSFIDGITKVQVRGSLFVLPQEDQLIEIVGEVIGDESNNWNETPVKNASGVADLRYRPLFAPGWTAVVEIEFDPSNIKAGQVVNLLNRGGLHIGIGDGRPQKKTDMGWGRFEVVEQV